MEKPKKDFAEWCVYAARKIRYIPVRRQVEEELYDHMEESYRDLLDRGYVPEEAEKEVIRRMGDVDELAEEMRQIHKPYGAYLLLSLRGLLFVCIFAILCLLPWAKKNLNIRDVEELSGYSAFALEEKDSRYDYRYLQVCEPGYEISSEHSQVTLKKFVRRYASYNKGGIEEALFLLEVKNDFPWMGEPTFWDRIYAVDSKGNAYYSRENWLDGREPQIVSAGDQKARTGLSSYSCIMEVHQMSSEGVDWLEIRFDYYGDEVRWRIDLEEGMV